MLAMLNNNTSHPNSEATNDQTTRKGEPAAIKGGAIDVAMERFKRIGFGMSDFLDAYEADRRTVIKDQTCKRCCRVLYFEDIGKDYRAVCCGQVYFEHKGRQQ